jgi:UDP-glucose 4-epimerase
MTKMLVTGASGAIGTALLKQLELFEYEVVGVDKEQTEWDLETPVIQQDLCDGTELPSSDVIIHLAAHSQVQSTLQKPSLAVENIRTTERVLEHAQQTDADVILASSREVYGTEIRPQEDDVSIEATNPYGASKIGSEAIAMAFQKCFSINVTTLRFANVYGPYDLNARVIPIFISIGSKGKNLTVYGDSKLLDFVYMDDVVDAIIQTVNKRKSLSGEAITIGSGQGVQLSELAEKMVDYIDDCPGYRIQPNRTGDTEKFVAQIEKARALLGLEPTHLEEGLLETIDWYQKHDKVLENIRNRIN